jgi:RhoGAP domain
LKLLRGVFGVDLTTLTKAHGTRLPFIVDMCIQEVERRGLYSEGIYRVSGLRDEVEALRMAFDKGNLFSRQLIDGHLQELSLVNRWIKNEFRFVILG